MLNKLLLKKLLFLGLLVLMIFSYPTPASAWNPITYIVDLWKTYTTPLEVITPVYTPVYVPAEEGLPPVPLPPAPVVRVAEPIIGNRGAQGPAGPQGPQGLQGPQGPAGPRGGGQ